MYTNHIYLGFHNICKLSRSHSYVCPHQLSPPAHHLLYTKMVSHSYINFSNHGPWWGYVLQSNRQWEEKQDLLVSIYTYVPLYTTRRLVLSTITSALWVNWPIDWVWLEEIKGTRFENILKWSYPRTNRFSKYLWINAYSH